MLMDLKQFYLLVLLFATMKLWINIEMKH
uniref:Uncharacterized protein n=1 Tax=Arundo donax TaxID=35708 RepID=A0A0A9HM76_ARUDO